MACNLPLVHANDEKMVYQITKGILMLKTKKLFNYFLLLFLQIIFSITITYAQGWKISVVDSKGYVGKDTSLFLDSQDNPHISYLDDTNSDLKYAYFDGKSWDIRTI